MFIEMSDGRDSNCKSLVLGDDRSTNCATSNVLFQSKFFIRKKWKTNLDRNHLFCLCNSSSYFIY